MKLLIAPGIYRGSLNSLEAAECMERGVRRVLPGADCVRLPLADGGEGTVLALHAAQGGTLLRKSVRDCAGKPVEALCVLLPDGSGVIEAAPLTALPAADTLARAPLPVSSYGVGELIRALLDWGCHTISVGADLGAPGDGGMGMARALGVRFLSRARRPLEEAAELEQLERVDLSGLDPRVAKTRIEVLTDVRLTLRGEEGVAARLRGLPVRWNEDWLRILDNGLRRLSQVVFAQFGLDLARRQGMGAVGGLAYGLSVFCSARVEPAAQTLARRLGLAERMAGCDLVLTGEGNLLHSDGRSSVSVAVASQAQEANIPVLAVSGEADADLEALRRHGLECIVNLADRPMLRADLADRAEELLCNASERALRLLRLGQRMAAAGKAL